VRSSDPTEDEARFFAEVARRVPGVQDWYHQDADGTLWMIVSYDVMGPRGMADTLRVDYDRVAVRGGVSPANLNWDDGVRAEAAGIDLTPPKGMQASGLDPIEAAQAASEWLLGRIDASRD
jgi:hypothetical protein